jgi:hypothetical protein
MYPKNHDEKKFMLNLAAPRNWRPYAAHISHSAKAGSVQATHFEYISNQYREAAYASALRAE